MVRIVQGSLNGGIISGGMYARTDTEKFQKGLKDAVNVFVRPQGGVSNRAGFAGATRFDTSNGVASQWLLPFSFNTEQTYHLEFADAAFRVIRSGAYVLDTTVGEIGITAVTTAAAAKITLTDPLDAAKFPVGCLAYLTDPAGSHALHEAYVRVTGAAGADLSFEVFDGTELDTTVGAWGAIGAGAALQKVYEVAHTYALADLPDVAYAQDADTMYLTHDLYPPRKVGRFDHDDWFISDVVFAPSVAQVQTATATITAATKTNPVVVTAAAHGLAEGDGFSIADVAGMIEINNKVFTAGAVTTDTVELKDMAGEPVDGTAYVAYTSGGAISSPGTAYKLSADADPLDLVTYSYAVAAIDSDTFGEGLPTELFTVDNDLFYKGGVNYIGWRAVPDASRYAVYRMYAGSLGYIGTTVSTVFTDENITADTATGVRLDRNPFAAAGDYPAVVSFYEQRLIFAATINDPQLVEASRVGDVENFCNSYPALPDDAFRFRVRDRRVNHIRALVPAESLTILTSGGEWEIAPQGDGEYLRPDKRRLSPRTNYGSSALPPLFTGSVVLYIEPSKNVVRDYRPNDFSTPPGDLTIVARDLFEDREIVSWTYAAAPHKLVWAALDDGTLLSMTYVPEHDVWAWTRHDMGTAKVKQVSSVREGNDDVVYAVVARQLGGKTVTLTERLARREDTDIKLAMYLDAGYIADFGGPVSTVQGLLHLRGETVTVLADGDVIEGLVVDQTGTVDLGTRAATNISVGLSYESLIETLDVQFEIKNYGSSDGRYKATAEMSLKIRRTRGIETGTSLDRMHGSKEWTADLVGGPIPLKSETQLVTVSGDWDRDATMYARQRNPLPMTILSIGPDWEVSE